jgi:cytoskeletal protein RodZ
MRYQLKRGVVTMKKKIWPVMIGLVAVLATAVIALAALGTFSDNQSQSSQSEQTSSQKKVSSQSSSTSSAATSSEAVASEPASSVAESEAAPSSEASISSNEFTKDEEGTDTVNGTPITQDMIVAARQKITAAGLPAGAFSDTDIKRLIQRSAQQHVDVDVLAREELGQ